MPAHDPDVWARGALPERIRHIVCERLAASIEQDTPAGRQRQLARSNFLEFTRHTYPGPSPEYVVNWHHHVVAARLQKWAVTPRDRLLIVMPSQHGKSSLVSRALPAWILGINPDAQVMACSHTHDWAASLNRDVQRVMDSENYIALFPGSRLSSANVRTIAQGTYLRNSDELEIVNRSGRYKSAGVGGPIAGRGFTHGIIDDPHKNWEEAASAVYREKIWNWFMGVFYQRASMGTASLLVTATRWNENDLIGRLLQLAKESSAAEQWDVLRFPIEGEIDKPEWDPRQPGEPLDRRVRDEAAIAAAKASTPPHQWAAMYIGQPTAMGGNVVQRQWFRYFGEEVSPANNGDAPARTFILRDDPDNTSSVRRFPAERCRWFQVCDTAQTIGQASDFTVVATFALTPEYDLLIYHVERVKLEIPAQFGLLRAMRQRFADRNLLFQAVERKASGIGLCQQARLAGMPFKELEPDGSKEYRASDVCGMYHAGKVFHRLGESWLHAFEDELLEFPNGKHDDCVDVCSYAGQLVRRDKLLRMREHCELILHPTAEEIERSLQAGGDSVTVKGHTVRLDDSVSWWQR